MQDRATQRKAFGVFLVRQEAKVSVVGAVVALAAHFFVAVDVVNATLDFIGTRLGYGIDIGTGVALLSDVVVGQINLHRLNRVDRNGLLGRRQVVGFQAEGVVDPYAVDGDGVVAAVLTACRNFTTLFVGLRQARVGACVVLQIATDGRKRVDFFAADVGAGAHARATKLGVGCTCNNHGIQCRATQCQVHSLVFCQLQIHLVTHVFVTALHHGDEVRTTHTQTAGCIAAIGVSHQRTGGAGLAVNNTHCGASNGLAVYAADTTSHGRCRVLGQGGCCHHNGDCGAQRRSGESREEGVVTVAHSLCS